MGNKMVTLRIKPNGYLWVLWIAAAFFIFPWLYIQFQTSVNSDVAWLSICAQRLIAGETLVQSCFDTNPPLSILIYVPFIFISKSLSIELYQAIFWGSFFLAILSTLISCKIIKYSNFFDEDERFIISLSFLCAITIIPTIYFAEREHFIAMILLPFILAQLCITYKCHIPAFLKYFTIIIAAIFLLIKPHFGLIPAFLFLHRMIVQKNILAVIKSPDFIILSLFSIGYICIIWLFFQDFITVILPDVMRFYLHYNNPQRIYSYAKIYGLIILLYFATSFLIPKGNKREVILMLTACALISLMIFIIQMKGLPYHLLPLYSLIFPLGFLISYNLIKAELNITNRYIYVAVLNGFFLIIFTVSYAFSPLTPDYPTHKAYQNNAITDYITRNCDMPCSYFMTHENMDITSQLAFYSGHIYATRFPSFWFQPAFDGLVAASKTKGKETLEDAKVRYANYIAQDITRMSPSLLFILRPQTTDARNGGFIQYYSVSEPFKKAISKYKKTDVLTIDRAYFYKGTKYDFEYLLTWDIYIKDG